MRVVMSDWILKRLKDPLDLQWVYGFCKMLVKSRVPS